jgi:hypothetical protein
LWRSKATPQKIGFKYNQTKVSLLKTMVSPAIAEKAEEIAIPKISLDEWVNNPHWGISNGLTAI